MISKTLFLLVTLMLAGCSNKPPDWSYYFDGTVYNIAGMGAAGKQITRVQKTDEFVMVFDAFLEQLQRDEKQLVIMCSLGHHGSLLLVVSGDRELPGWRGDTHEGSLRAYVIRRGEFLRGATTQPVSLWPPSEHEMTMIRRLVAVPNAEGQPGIIQFRGHVSAKPKDGDLKWVEMDLKSNGAMPLDAAWLQHEMHYMNVADDQRRAAALIASPPSEPCTIRGRLVGYWHRDIDLP